MPKRVLKCICCKKDSTIDLSAAESVMLSSHATEKVFPMVKRDLHVCERCERALEMSESLVVTPFPMKDKFITPEDFKKLKRR